jgi:hypothetical protein
MSVTSLGGLVAPWAIVSYDSRNEFLVETVFNVTGYVVPNVVIGQNLEGGDGLPTLFSSTRVLQRSYHTMRLRLGYAVSTLWTMVVALMCVCVCVFVCDR